MSYLNVVEFNDEQKQLTETLTRDAVKAWRLRHMQLWETRLFRKIAARVGGFIRRALRLKRQPGRVHREQLYFH